MKIIKLYNEKLNTLPEKFYSELDLAVLLDLFLDIFRYKRAQQVIIDSAFIIKDAKKIGMDNYKLQAFLKKFVAGDGYENIFHTLINQAEKLYIKNFIKNPIVAGALIAESLLTDSQQLHLGEISTLITNFIDPQGRRSEASSQRGSKPKPTEESQISNNPPPQLSLRKIKPTDIPDDFRINIAKELKEKIEDKYLPPKGQYLYETSKVLNDDQLEKLHDYAQTLV